MLIRTLRAVGIAAAGLLTACSGVSADTTPRPEVSLLGIRLLGSYSDVLRKFGQPNEIQPGDPVVSGAAQGAVAAGPRMGGMMGSAGPGAMMGSAGPGAGGYQNLAMGGGRMGGFQGSGNPGMMMGSAGPGAMMGSAGPGAMMGGYQGMAMGGGRMGGFQGSGNPGAMGSGGPGALPGLGGPGAMAGRMGGTGLAGGAQANGTAGDSGESTWWYHFPQQGLHYSFLFNKEGRVIQIQAYGQKPDAKIVAPRSAQGITLGSELGQVISRYGWSNEGEHSGDYVVMSYGQRNRIAFQTRHNKVLGIVLGRVNPQAAIAPTNYVPGGQGGFPGAFPGGQGGFRGGFPGGQGGFRGAGGGGKED